MRSVLLRGKGGKRLGALGQLELWPLSVVSSAPDVSHNLGVTLVHSRELVGVGGQFLPPRPDFVWHTHFFRANGIYLTRASSLGDIVSGAWFPYGDEHNFSGWGYKNARPSEEVSAIPYPNHASATRRTRTAGRSFAHVCAS